MYDRRVLALRRCINERPVRIEEAIVTSPPATLHPNRAHSRTEAACLLGVSVTTIGRARNLGLLAEARKLGKRCARITGESLGESQKGEGADVIRILGA